VSLKKNILANYLGQGWRALMELAFIPVYIKYLGIEAYGLIGIFALLQAWLTLLDMGMTPTLIREMARFTGGAHSAQAIRDLLRSIEIIAFGMAISVALGIWAASGWLASDWLIAEKLPVDTVAKAFAVMGVIIALRFIENIYRSSIVGLQKQVLLNIINSFMATLRGIGAVGILIWMSSTIEAFFLWQGVISVLNLVLFALIVYRTLPMVDHGGRFSRPALQDIWHFSSGMVVITFLSLLITQMDKILLSHILTLKVFGYYVFAGVVASGLNILSTAIADAYFPDFVKILSHKDEIALRRSYHQGAQLVIVVVGAAAFVLMLFADRMLLLWTGDPIFTQQVTPIAIVLVFGTFIHCLLVIPYQMQLAYGWTSITIRVNTVAIAIFVPANVLIVPIYGVMGAAWLWVVLNVGCFIFGMNYMYRRILTTEKWIWYRDDVLFPLVVAAATTLVCRWMLPVQLSLVGELLVLVSSYVATIALSSLAAPLIRKSLFDFVRKLNKQRSRI